MSALVSSGRKRWTAIRRKFVPKGNSIHEETHVRFRSRSRGACYRRSDEARLESLNAQWKNIAGDARYLSEPGMPTLLRQNSLKQVRRYL
jgi:hypothetical protein